MCPGPGATNAVECAHGTLDLSFGERLLEGFQIDFADSLLVREGADALTVGFLIVQCKMLDVADNTVILQTFHFLRGKFTGKEAILGIILKVTAGIRCAMDIDSRRISAYRFSTVPVLTHCGADFIHQVTVKRASAENFTAEAGSICAILHICAELVALRAVLHEHGRIRNGRNGRQCRAGDNAGHLPDGKLVQDLIPSFRVIERNAVHFCQCHLVVLTGNDSGSIAAARLIAAFCVNGRHHIRRGRQISIAFGEGAPVAAGQIIRILPIVFQTCIIETVGYFIPAVRNIQQGFLGIVPEINFLCITFGIHAILNRLALCSQNIIQCIVGAVANSEVVVTGIQHIGLVGLVIVRRELFLRHCDRDRLRLTGFQDIRLVKTNKLYGGFLNAAAGIRLLCVKLHDVFARSSAVVRNFDLHFQPIITHLGRNNFLRKRKPILSAIAQTIAEGIADFIVIIPRIAYESTRRGQRVRTGGIRHTIGITRLIITIADVDALAVHNILCAVVCLADRRVYFIGIRESEIAKVLHSGGREGIRRIGIGQATGGVHFAVKYFSNRTRTTLPNTADPEAGIDPILFLIDPAQFHRVGSVDHGNDFIKSTAVLDFLQQSFFRRLQSEVLFAVAKCTGRHIRTLTAYAGEYHNGRIIIVCVRLLDLIGVFTYRNFCRIDILRLGTHIAAVAADIAVFSIVGFIEIPNCAVDGETTVCLHCRFEVDHIVCVDITCAGATENQINRRTAKQCHFGAFSKR